MHRSAFALLAAAAIIAGCDTPPSAPPEAPAAPSLKQDGRPDHENTTTPFSRTVTNPCGQTPEPIPVEGLAHYNAHFKFFEGGNQARLKSTIHASGVGAVTGLKYQFHELWTLYGRYTYVNSRWETEQTTRFHVISQTNVDNFFATIRTKVVYTLTSIEVQSLTIETDCRG